LAKQAQENYAILTQAFKRVLADNNTTSLSETEVWSKLSKNIDCINNPSSNKDFFTELGKYIKISPSAKLLAREYNDKKDGSSKVAIGGYPINLPNGAQIVTYSFYQTPKERTEKECTKIKTFGGNMCNYIGPLRIDINGAKGPNTEGRDLFRFYLSDEGVLYPYYGKDWAIYNYPIDLSRNRYYWKNYYDGTKEQNAKKYQLYRTGQLVEEGWKMNY
jgi:hypothetical protein